MNRPIMVYFSDIRDNCKILKKKTNKQKTKQNKQKQKQNKKSNKWEAKNPYTVQRAAVLLPYFKNDYKLL